MDRSRIVKTIKEKGPLFAGGAIVGALVATVVFHREKIKETLDAAWKSLSKEG